MTNQTIYALSTAYGKSGVAVVRVSGPHALQAVAALTDMDVHRIKPRYAYFAALHQIDKRPLDKGLVLYFKAPQSFTGEDIVEFQIHGSKAVIAVLLENLGSLPDFRLAEAGEFSKRAFYNQKMDLTEAEGLADLIEAETEVQHQTALRQMEGNLKNLYENWRRELLSLLAILEAYVDFPDEELPSSQEEKIKNTVFKLLVEIKEHLADSQCGERLRDGFRVVIAGPANAGKSSLLNTVAGREAVIVSSVAGTTRDAVDINLDLGGWPVVLTDTAGLRQSAGQIEQQGIRIAETKINQADLIIYLFDAYKDSVQQFDNITKKYSDKCLLVANKKDLIGSERRRELEQKGCLVISARDKADVNNLLRLVESRLKSRFSGLSGQPVTRRRYREALQKAADCLSGFSLNKEIELAVEDIRLTAREIGKITGSIEVEEILDKIFSSFCIGK